MNTQTLPTPCNVLVTPELARQFLEKNDGNRVVRPRTVDTYAQNMKDGEFLFSESMICISPEDKLLNGQHRLLAIVKSGVSVYMTLAYGVPETAYAYMDTGSKRTSADLLHNHEIQNSIHIASLVKASIYYKKYTNYSPKAGTISINITSKDILSEYQTDPEDYQHGVRLSRITNGLITPQTSSLIAYLGIKHFGLERTEQFFSGLSIDSLGDYEKGDPRRTLVETIVTYKLKSKQKMPIPTQANYLAKAFNTFIKKAKIHVLRQGPTEDVITLITLKS